MPVKHLFLEEQKQNGINILQPDMILWSKIFHLCPGKICVNLNKVVPVKRTKGIHHDLLCMVMVRRSFSKLMTH